MSCTINNKEIYSSNKIELYEEIITHVTKLHNGFIDSYRTIADSV